MRSHLAPALLALVGVLHLGALGVLGLPGRARPLTAGDVAFLAGAGALYLVAANAVTRQHRWGRWLGVAISGVEAVPGLVLFYVVAVFSADPANRGSLAQLGLLPLLLAPLIVCLVVWRHRF